MVGRTGGAGLRAWGKGQGWHGYVTLGLAHSTAASGQIWKL